MPGDWLSCLLQQFTRRSGDARAHDYVSLLEVRAARLCPRELGWAGLVRPSPSRLPCHCVLPAARAAGRSTPLKSCAPPLPPPPPPQAMPLLNEEQQQAPQQGLGQLTEGVVSKFASKFEVCDSSMLAKVAGSLAQMQFVPGPEWVAAHQAAYARSVLAEEALGGVDDQEQARLQMAYDSWSKQQERDAGAATQPAA